jgi:hypothetical protein
MSAPSITSIQTVRYCDANGSTLWEEPMLFWRLFRAGDEIFEKRKFYRVTDVKIDDEIQVVHLSEMNPQADGFWFRS